MSLLKSIAFGLKGIFGGYMLIGQRLRFPGALLLGAMISMFVWATVELHFNRSQPLSSKDWVMSVLLVLYILPSLGLLLAGWFWKMLGWSLPKTSSGIFGSTDSVAHSWLLRIVWLFNIGGFIVVPFMVLAAIFWLLPVLGVDA